LYGSPILWKSRWSYVRRFLHFVERHLCDHHEHKRKRNISMSSLWRAATGRCFRGDSRASCPFDPQLTLFPFRSQIYHTFYVAQVGVRSHVRNGRRKTPLWALRVLYISHRSSLQPLANHFITSLYSMDVNFRADSKEIITCNFPRSITWIHWLTSNDNLLDIHDTCRLHVIWLSTLIK